MLNRQTEDRQTIVPECRCLQLTARSFFASCQKVANPSTR